MKLICQNKYNFYIETTLNVFVSILCSYFIISKIFNCQGAKFRIGCKIQYLSIVLLSLIFFKEIIIKFIVDPLQPDSLTNLNRNISLF